MSIIAYILLAFSLAISMYVMLRDCSANTHIRLSFGLLVAFSMTLVKIVMLLLGTFVGNILRFDIPEVDNLVFLGIMVFVAVRIFISVFSKKETQYAYNIAKYSTVILLSVANGINALILGIGIGFKTFVENDILKMSIPLFLLGFLFCMWAIMLGRQQVQIRPRRWTLFSVLFLLAFTLMGAFLS